MSKSRIYMWICSALSIPWGSLNDWFCKIIFWSTLFHQCLLDSIFFPSRIEKKRRGGNMIIIDHWLGWALWHLASSFGFLSDLIKEGHLMEAVCDKVFSISYVNLIQLNMISNICWIIHFAPTYSNQKENIRAGF